MSVPMPETGGETTGTENVGGSEPVETTGGENAGGESMNPAWNPLLEKLPSSLHQLITPELRSWDKNFQDKISEVQSQYEPYKQFLDNKIEPQTIEQAIGLYNLINQNPQLVYEQMQQFYGFGGGQGQEDQGNNPQGEEEEFDLGDPNADITQHPKFQEMAQNQQLLAQVIMEEHNAKQEAALSQQIEDEISAVKEKNPDIDELLLVQTALGGNMTIAEAADYINSYNERILTASKRPAPKLFPVGGALPAAEQPDPTKMDSKQTRQTVAAILAAANQPN